MMSTGVEGLLKEWFLIMPSNIRSRKHVGDGSCIAGVTFLILRYYLWRRFMGGEYLDCQRSIWILHE